jgi:hypothetical protein
MLADLLSACLKIPKRGWVVRDPPQPVSNARSFWHGQGLRLVGDTAALLFQTGYKYFLVS